MKSTKLSVFKILLFCLAATAYSQDYAVKPAWWDSTAKVSIEKANNLYNSYFKSIEKNKADRTKLENWMEIGPFERNGDKAFDTVYPPEKEVKLDASYPGKDKQVSWIKWPAGEKSPIPENISEAVFFFYNTISVQKPTQKFLFFFHDDGAELRLNGKVVFQNKAYISPDTPDIVPLDLKAGKNELLIKLDQGGGPWGLGTSLGDVSPVYVEIRIITELLKAFPSDVPEVVEMLAGKLINDYTQLQDFQNMLFWAEYLFKRKTQISALRKILEDSYNICLKDEKMQANGKDFFKKIFDNKSFDIQLRGVAAKFMIELMLKREELDELIKFIDANYLELKDSIGNDRFFYKLKAYIAKSDYDNSKSTIKDMELIPEIKDKPEFQDLKRRAETLKATAIMIKSDWELNTNIENAAKFNTEKNTLKLNRLIQNTLISKNASLLETDDKNLLTGAVQKYKELFKPYENEYAKSFDKYFEVFGKKKGSLSEIQTRKRKVLLSLSPQPAPKKEAEQALNGISEMNLADSDRYAFKPIAALNPGYIEMLKNDNVFTGKASYALNASSTVIKDIVLIQNSRQLLCIKGDRLLWNRQLDNSVIQTDREKIPENTPIFTGSFSPKTNGQMVFSRLMYDGKFSIFAFDAADGHTIWDTKAIDHAICSDPVLYQDQIIVLAKKSDVITQYFLLVLNAASGKLEAEIYLFSGEEVTPLQGLYDIWAVRLDVFMPEPAIKDGRAYISTNSGIVFCVDIEGDFTVWARKYSRVPFIAQNMDLGYALGRRKNILPAVGSKNVLFAPVDAPGVFLLSKDTGAIVMESSSIKALDIRQTGMDSALVIDKNNSASLYSLKGLEQTKPLPRTDYSFMEKLKDGFILAGNKVLETWSDAGTLSKKIKLPASFMPVTVSKNGIFGYVPDKIKPLIGILTPQAGNYPEPSCAEKNVQKLNNPQIIEVDKNYLIKADNYIVMLDSKLFTEWTVPLRSKNTTILSTGNFVYLISKNTLVALNRKDGSIVNRFPKEGEAYKNYHGPAIFAGKLYVGEAMPQNNKMQILMIDGPKNEYKGIFNFIPNMLNILNNGDSLLIGQHNVMDIYKFNKDTTAYDKTDKTFKLSKNVWEYRRITIEDKPTLFINPQDCFTFDPVTSSISKFPIKNWPNVKWDWGMHDSNFNVIDKIAACSLQQHVWLLLDMESRTDLSNNVNFYTSPVYDSGNLLGLVVNDMSKPPWEFKFSAVCFDIKSKNIVYKQEINPYLNLNNQNAWNDMNFMAGDKSLHFFHPTANKEISEETNIVIQDYKNKKAELKTFPGYLSCPDAISANGNVLLLINSGQKVFTIENLLKFTDKVAMLYEVPLDAKIKYEIDGYPDEWDMSQFHIAGKNKFFATVDKDKLVFAAQINDENLIRNAGVDGLEKCIDMTLMPGSAACFRTDNMKSAGFTYDFSERDPDLKFEYSVSSSGDTCFFEISIPLKKIFHVDPNWIVNIMKDSKHRFIRGDIAFSFAMTDEKNNRQNLFTKDDSIPLYYPRLKFMFDKKK